MSQVQCDCSLCNLARDVQANVQRKFGIELEFMAVHDAIYSALPEIVKPLMIAAKTAEVQAAEAVARAKTSPGCGDPECQTCADDGGVAIPEELKALLANGDAEVVIVGAKPGEALPPELAALLSGLGGNVRQVESLGDLPGAVSAEMAAAVQQHEAKLEQKQGSSSERLRAALGALGLNERQQSILSVMADAESRRAFLATAPGVLEALGARDPMDGRQKLIDLMAWVDAQSEALNENDPQALHKAAAIEAKIFDVLESITEQYASRWAAHDPSSIAVCAMMTRVFNSSRERLLEMGMGRHPLFADAVRRCEALQERMVQILAPAFQGGHSGNTTVH